MIDHLLELASCLRIVCFFLLFVLLLGDASDFVKMKPKKLKVSHYLHMRQNAYRESSDRCLFLDSIGCVMQHLINFMNFTLIV